MSLEPAAQLVDVTKQVGRHFSIVNGLSSLVVVLVPAALVAGGAPGEAPSLRSIVTAVNEFGFGAVVTFGVLALAVGFALHPLQFRATQFLEGYWGPSAPSQRAMVRSTRRLLARWLNLIDQSDDANVQIDRTNDLILRARLISSHAKSQAHRDRARAIERRLLLRRVGPIVQRQEALRAAAQLPDRAEDLMPTRLGNTLRRFERLAGAPFGLDAIVSTPFMAQVAGDVERSYHDDSRTNLDLSVRMILVWTICSVATLVLLWKHGMWLLLPTCTAMLAFVAYRGAVASAAQYGTALMVMTALSRRHLYDALGLAPPADSDAELALNRSLSFILAGHPSPTPLDYQWPAYGPSGAEREATSEIQGRVPP